MSIIEKMSDNKNPKVLLVCYVQYWWNHNQFRNLVLSYFYWKQKLQFVYNWFYLLFLWFVLCIIHMIIVFSLCMWIEKQIPTNSFTRSYLSTVCRGPMMNTFQTNCYIDILIVTFILLRGEKQTILAQFQLN